MYTKLTVGPEKNNAKVLRIYGEGNGTPLHTLAWKIPWMEEPGRLQSMGSLRVGHDWPSLSCIGTKGHCHPRASSAKTRGFHTQLDEGPETP